MNEVIADIWLLRRKSTLAEQPFVTSLLTKQKTRPEISSSVGRLVFRRYLQYTDVPSRRGTVIRRRNGTPRFNDVFLLATHSPTLEYSPCSRERRHVRSMFIDAEPLWRAVIFGAEVKDTGRAPGTGHRAPGTAVNIRRHLHQTDVGSTISNMKRTACEKETATNVVYMHARSLIASLIEDDATAFHLQDAISRQRVFIVWSTPKYNITNTFTISVSSSECKKEYRLHTNILCIGACLVSTFELLSSTYRTF